MSIKLWGLNRSPEIGEGGGGEPDTEIEADVNTPDEGEDPNPDSVADGEGVGDEPKKQSRWQKMVARAEAAEAKIADFERNFKELEGAKSLDAWVRGDPERARYMMDLIQGKLPAPWEKKEAGEEAEEDPLAEFDPVIANKLRDLEKFKEDVLREREVGKQNSEKAFKQRIAENKASLDKAFDELLIADKYMDKDGKGNEFVTAMLSKATLAGLYEIAKNPQFPTVNEMKTAYEKVKQGLSEYSRHILKTTVNDGDPPPSGSGSGLPPDPSAVDKSGGEDARIKRIVGYLNSKGT